MKWLRVVLFQTVNLYSVVVAKSYPTGTVKKEMRAYKAQPGQCGEGGSATFRATHRRGKSGDVRAPMVASA